MRQFITAEWLKCRIERDFITELSRGGIQKGKHAYLLALLNATEEFSISRSK